VLLRGQLETSKGEIGIRDPLAREPRSGWHGMARHSRGWRGRAEQGIARHGRAWQSGEGMLAPAGAHRDFDTRGGDQKQFR
jgi:hypothetical protein